MAPDQGSPPTPSPQLLVREPGTRRYRAATGLEVTAAALAHLEQTAVARDSLLSPTATAEYLRLKLGALDHEVFGVLFLNAQNGVLACVDVFRGTLTQTQVYPREIAKDAVNAPATKRCAL